MVAETSDEVLSALTVTEVRVSPDLSHARVFVMCHRPLPGEPQVGSREDLDYAAEKVQKLLAPEIRLRRTPKLRFEIDDTEEKAEGLERLLEQVREDWEDADRNS
jgi:ribosome-binding factor A